MKIEHSAWQVEDAAAVADWYVAHLGMRIVRSGPAPVNMRFLADSTGRVLLEIYTNPKAAIPDYRTVHPLTIHLAFAVDDVRAQRDRLLAAGATIFEDVAATPAGDEMAMLRDPWGFPIQIIRRAVAM